MEEKERRNVLICSAVELDDTKSTRKLAEELGIGNKTVARVLKKNDFRSFKYSKTQEIFEQDNIRRMEFCETVMEKSNADGNFIKNIIFTDESTFPLHGKHNPSILRYWARENKHRSYAYRSQYPEKLNVWAGILDNHLVGPFFIDGSLNAQKYLTLLQEQVLPAIQNLPGVDQNDVWFQQDGCPAHNAVRVREFLTTTFPDRLISGTGDIRWPPRSPDLSPNDFFLWGYLKNTVYDDEANRARNLQELRAKITEAANTVTAEMLSGVRDCFYNRLGFCLVQQGGIFEPFI